VRYPRREAAILFMTNPRGSSNWASRHSSLSLLSACCVFALSSPVLAGETFGIFDARTLAMGGASVASANNSNAQFYNAALLAFNEEIEERTQDSRFLFPLLTPQLSESAIDIEELAGDDPSQSITRAVNDFNAMPDALTAQSVVDVTAKLDAALADIDDEDVFADAYVGFALSEPGKLHGAGFFMGARLLGGGRSTVTAADRALLGAYQEGLSFVASGGAEGAAHPELFDANGALIDPGNELDSTVSATGAVVVEIGVAMSKQIYLFGYPIAAGISFKVLEIDTFEDVERVVDDRIDVEQNSETDANVNFDIGLAKEFGDRWRVGLAVKDIIPHNYKTSLGTVIRFRPRPRIGAAYQAGRLQVGIDADLIRSQTFANERPTQEAAVGVEWSLGSPVKLRAGYRYDFRGSRAGIVSLGAGTLWKRLAVDVAYAQGPKARAAALQFGIAF
jgi:hypothetical protein